MSDLISRQAAIEVMGAQPLNWTDSSKEIAEELMWEDHVKALKELPSVTPQPKTENWIPVSEKLPKEEGDYLLWGKIDESEENHLFVGKYDSGCEQFGDWWEQFDKSTLGCIGSDFSEYSSVIAWMPLPQPYVPDTYVGKKAESEE